MSEQNPTPKHEPVRTAPERAQTSEQKDEPWIRDVRARDFIVAVADMETAEKVCEGLFTHCTCCGEKFPLWPPKLLMGHSVAEHAKEVTTQQLTGWAALCGDEFTLVQSRYFGILLVTTVAVRRRCRDLGLIKFIEPQEESPKRIVVPN